MRLILGQWCCGLEQGRAERECLVIGRMFGCGDQGASNCRGCVSNFLKSHGVVEVSLILNASFLVFDALIVLSGQMLRHRALDAMVSLPDEKPAHWRTAS